MALFPPLARAVGVLEIIDGPAVPFKDMTCCMTDIARVNALFGGRMVTMVHVRRLLAALPTDRLITVLDVGTGAGDIPRELVRWARRQGRCWGSKSSYRPSSYWACSPWWCSRSVASCGVC